MIERWFEPFTLLIRTGKPDGLGGEHASFAPDFAFEGMLTLTAGVESAVAEQRALVETPVLLFEFDVTLAPGDYVRREKDGAIYRVTDRPDNLRAPAFSVLKFSQAPVERVVIPC